MNLARNLVRGELAATLSNHSRGIDNAGRLEHNPGHGDLTESWIIPEQAAEFDDFWS